MSNANEMIDHHAYSETVENDNNNIFGLAAESINISLGSNSSVIS